MTDVKVGNIVRIGETGKVEYEVTKFVTLDTVNLKGEKSNRKNVSVERLIVVPHAPLALLESVIGTDERENEIIQSLDDVQSVEGVTFPLAAWEVELSTTHNKRYSLVLNDTITGYKSFEAAAFALSRAKGTYKWASIDDHNRGVRVAERIAA